ncbi:MAG: hypothetical protein WCP20_01065 [Desulfuromonadales bacterium]
MPAPQRDRDEEIIKLFFSGYEEGVWASSEIEWPDKTEDGTVDAFIERPTLSGAESISLELTLVEIFIGDRADFAKFKSFLSIENDASLRMPDRTIFINIERDALRKGYKWSDIVNELHQWLKSNIASFPDGETYQKCQIHNVGKSPDLDLTLQVQAFYTVGGSSLLIRRYGTVDLAMSVEKALTDKIPKLVKTQATKRILLLERDFHTSEQAILAEIEKLRPSYTTLGCVDEIWFAETAYYPKHVRFNRHTGNLIEHFDFLDGKSWPDEINLGESLNI